jgi:DNA polymerase III epsilon subunit-like protein
MDPNMLGNYAYLSFPELSERWHAVDKEETRHIKSGLIIEIRIIQLFIIRK